MSTEQNKQMVLDFFAEVMNQRNNEAIQKYFVPGTFLAGHMENLLKFTTISFPDFQINIEDVIAEEDRVAIRTIIRGTHQGVFFGHPPTGKPMQANSIYIFKIKEGKIVSFSHESNLLVIYQQLGISPVIAQDEPDA